MEIDAHTDKITTMHSNLLSLYIADLSIRECSESISVVRRANHTTILMQTFKILLVLASCNIGILTLPTPLFIIALHINIISSVIIIVEIIEAILICFFV